MSQKKRTTIGFPETTTKDTQRLLDSEAVEAYGVCSCSSVAVRQQVAQGMGVREWKP